MYTNLLIPTDGSELARKGRPAGDELALASKGEIAGIGTVPHFRAVELAGRVVTERRWTEGSALGHETFLTELFGWIAAQSMAGSFGNFKRGVASCIAPSRPSSIA